ncbi:MAG: ATP-dependent DNA helicase RecG [Clostridia bacterium]|nr:ATP-dependent DNA helicase RecG [Lachnospiraceae bacterium]NCB99302.1 ATP-dependent DNA helicase RecG [Clostridia bacterium]NCD01451.1 ATP-dependent DNA helicase RecG [Clostridia bacterium]
MKVMDSVRCLKGVGDKIEKSLNKLGIYTIEDLLEYYPRAYQTYSEPVDISEVIPEKKQAVIGFLQRSLARIPGGRVEKTSGTLSDGSRRIQLLWYRMPYLRKQIISGKTYIFYGTVKNKKGQWTMEQPEIFEPAAYEKVKAVIWPIYSLTEGVNQKMIIRLTEQVLKDGSLFEDYLPESLRQELGLSEYNYAIHNIHFPENMNGLELARRRLGFDEFFLFALAIRRMKASRERSDNQHPAKAFQWSQSFIKGLSYALTNAQLKAWKEIAADFSGLHAMNRLLQGDVGSGKTVLAQLALLTAVESGYQGCLMAPTEVLARQHYENFLTDFQKLSEDTGILVKCALLVGSMTAKEKRDTYEALKEHQIDILIGTHAVIQEKVHFNDLGLVVTDEQHRFGVNQREWLSGKGSSPHVLVMSATPIPRTLAIIVYGDLDISVIDELPARRKPIKNCVVNTGYRPSAYRFIEKQVREGHQVYVICPMVEESEFMDLENVMDYTEKIKTALPPDIQVGYLHGKMTGIQKDEIMESFRDNKIQVLVSTTVIEVGINVPNATVMMVENAERFGLAQLHQLRGRVGRGDAQSYCIFIQSGTSEQMKERLEILVHSDDGFFIANEDLKLRGPGDMFGLRQSGLMDFHIGDLYQDRDLLGLAGECAKKYEKELPENLERRMHRYMSMAGNDIIL